MLFFQIFRNGNGNPLATAFENHVKEKWIRLEHAQHHRTKPVAAAYLFRNCAVIRLRIADAEGESSVRSLLEHLEDGVKILFQLLQPDRQSLRGGDKSAKGDRLADGVKQGFAAALFRQHSPDRPGDVIFRVAQTNIEIRFTAHFDIDQIIVIQRPVLIAVSNQQIKIGVHQ